MLTSEQNTLASQAIANLTAGSHIAVDAEEYGARATDAARALIAAFELLNAATGESGKALRDPRGEPG